MRRLYATAAIGAAPIAGLALVPSADDHPSGLFILRNIPGGVFGGIYASFRHYTQSAHQPSASYEAHATTSNGINVHLVGTSHTNPRSAEAAHAAITSHANASSLAAVAVECDAQTLALVRCAHEAIEGLPIERVKSEGLGVVREALWNSKTVRDMAEKEGKELESPASIGLPPALTHHLTNDGVLWGDEMRAAADAADAAGVRVVCLDSTASTAAANATPPSKLGMIAFGCERTRCIRESMKSLAMRRPPLPSTTRFARRCHARTPSCLRQRTSAWQRRCRSYASSRPAAMRRFRGLPTRAADVSRASSLRSWEWGT